MRRGDVVIIRQRGEYEGKPRPAIVIQSDLFADHPSTLVCLVTTEIEPAPYRVPVEPEHANGLRSTSMILADRITTIRQRNIGPVIGRLDARTIARLDDALRLVQGLA